MILNFIINIYKLQLIQQLPCFVGLFAYLKTDILPEYVIIKKIIRKYSLKQNSGLYPCIFGQNNY